MELSEVLGSSHVEERLRFAGVLLGMMEGQEDATVHALTGGAAMWLGSVDQTLESANPLVCGRTYKTRRNEEAGGQALIGLRLARNEIAHGEALAMLSDASFPVKFPVRFELRFVSGSELVALGAKRGKTKQPNEQHLRHYEAYIADRGPHQVLFGVYRWLEGLISVE